MNLSPQKHIPVLATKNKSSLFLTSYVSLEPRYKTLFVSNHLRATLGPVVQEIPENARTKEQPGFFSSSSIERKICVLIDCLCRKSA